LERQLNAAKKQTDSVEPPTPNNVDETVAKVALPVADSTLPGEQ
jgi:hypothetical protein